MDSDQAKLFLGGISPETTEATLQDYFGQYGAVLGSTVAKDRSTGIPRGFGFVWFSDPSSADKALQDSHVILGRKVPPFSISISISLFLFRLVIISFIWFAVKGKLKVN